MLAVRVALVETLRQSGDLLPLRRVDRRPVARLVAVAQSVVLHRVVRQASEVQ